MPSLVYNSFWDDQARGAIVPASDSIRVMLVTAAYAEDKDAHLKRNQVTNEIVGAGYAAGGAVVPVTVVKDNVTDRIDVVLGAVNFPASSLVARKAVYYKSRGGAANLDELIAVNDFGADVATTNGTFTINPSTIRVQN